MPQNGYLLAFEIESSHIAQLVFFVCYIGTLSGYICVQQCKFEGNKIRRQCGCGLEENCCCLPYDMDWDLSINKVSLFMYAFLQLNVFI